MTMTPGPRKIVYCAGDDPPDWEVQTEDGKFIATCATEADAKAIAALPELVEWADEFIALEDEALGEWANETITPPTGNEPFMVRLKRLKAIRAKIGEKL